MSEGQSEDLAPAPGGSQAFLEDASPRFAHDKVIEV